MIAEASLEVPVVVMTYVNPIYRHGFEAFLDEAERAGVAGVIVPDLPFDEAEDWISTCASHSVAAVQLTAPGTVIERLTRIAAAAHGFVYCVATYGVTGARDSLAGTAEELVGRLRPLTDLPLLVGVGVGTPQQAAEVGAFADGAIVGSALMERMLDHDSDGLLTLAGDFRNALRTG
jgi:tryptophan synthase alpha chain